MSSSVDRDERVIANRVRNVNEAARMIGNLVSVMESDRSLDGRWVAIAKTDLQRGFMALRRALMTPEEF